MGRRLENHAHYILAKRDAKERYWENVGINKNLDSDTLDTLINIYNGKLSSSTYSLHMYSGEASKASKKGYKANFGEEKTQKDISLEKDTSKLISYPNNSDNPVKTGTTDENLGKKFGDVTAVENVDLGKKFCGQDFKDEKLSYETFTCGQMGKHGERLKCPKCSNDENTRIPGNSENSANSGDLSDLKEKCVECGKTPATMTRDGSTFYCMDCAKLLLGGKKA